MESFAKNIFKTTIVGENYNITRYLCNAGGDSNFGFTRPSHLVYTSYRQVFTV